MATPASASPRFSASQPTRKAFGSPHRCVLIVGNPSPITALLSEGLAEDKLQILSLPLEQALIRLQKGMAIDTVLLQVQHERCLETIAALRELRVALPVIAFSSVHNPELAAKAMKLGASDYIQLPFGMEQLKSSVRNSMSMVEGHRPEEDNVSETAVSDGNSLVCASTRMNEIRGQCAILARVDLPILILGESGTGKEVIANYLHKMSPRAHRTFLKVNCAAMPADLLESELFGFEQGAFTGAVRSKPGRFELCNMGTILLDEIGEMPAQLQSKLLQVLQDGTFSRLGGRTCIKVDVRVIAATNIDMHAAIAARSFREDLYYRLNGFTIHLPPLRERKAEIPALILHFMRKLSEKYARQPIMMSEQLMSACAEYHWPGNLRELENYVKRFLVLGDEQLALAELKRASERTAQSAAKKSPVADISEGLKKVARNAMGEAEAEAMSEALVRNNWNRKQTALELQISYKALLYKIRQYGLSPMQNPRPPRGLENVS